MGPHRHLFVAQAFRMLVALYAPEGVLIRHKDEQQHATGPQIRFLRQAGQNYWGVWGVCGGGGAAAIPIEHPTSCKGVADAGRQ